MRPVNFGKTRRGPAGRDNRTSFEIEFQKVTDRDRLPLLMEAQDGQLAAIAGIPPGRGARGVPPGSGNLAFMPTPSGMSPTQMRPPPKGPGKTPSETKQEELLNLLEVAVYELKKDILVGKIRNSMADPPGSGIAKQVSDGDTDIKFLRVLPKIGNTPGVQM